jgi:hypothetical protein
MVKDRPVVNPFAEGVGIEDAVQQQNRLLLRIPIFETATVSSASRSSRQVTCNVKLPRGRHSEDRYSKAELEKMSLLE